MNEEILNCPICHIQPDIENINPRKYYVIHCPSCDNQRLFIYGERNDIIKSWNIIVKRLNKLLSI